MEGSPYITPPFKAQHPNVQLPTTTVFVVEVENPSFRISTHLCVLVWWGGLHGSLRLNGGLRDRFLKAMSPYPFHHTKYCNFLPLILLSIISSTSYLCSPPTISGGGGLHILLPSIGLMTWNTRWMHDMDWGSFSRYACEPTGQTMGKGPR